MDDYAWGLLAGVTIGLLVVAILKLRLRGSPMSVAEKAEYLSGRRARMLPVLAIIYITQQATYFTVVSGAAHRPADDVKISAWLVFSIILLAALSTKGFWLERREVRSMIDDELTQANRQDAMRFGFIFAMLTCIVIYAITMFEPVNGRDAVHVILSDGLGAALIRWGWLERVAHRNA
jgi:hypothetical protein